LQYDPDMRKAVAVLGLLVALSVHASSPELVFDIGTNAQDSDPGSFFSTGDRAYFFANDGSGSELWITDGTAAGTRQVAELTPGPSPESAADEPDFTVSGHLVWFWYENFFADDDWELWRTDGTREGTFRVARSLGYPSDLAPIGERGIVARSSEAFLSSDGTVEGTQSIEIDDGFVLGGASTEQLVAFRGHVYFIEGPDLWRTDGTLAGTSRVGAFPEDVDDIDEMVAGDDAIYIVAESDSTWERRYILRSDGAPPVLIATHEVDPDDAPRLVANRGVVHALIGVDGKLTAIWRLGPAPQRMTVVEGDMSSYSFLDAAGGSIFFATDNPDTLWRSDGTAAGTRVFEGVDLSWEFYVTGERVFSLRGDGIYVSDGATATKVTSREPQTYELSAAPIGNGIVVSVEDPEHGEELWFSDGTPQGTGLVKNIRADGDSGAESLRRVDDLLIFSAHTDAEGREPWVSDGTLFGTRLLADIDLGSWGSAPRAITPLPNGRAVFVAADHLYATDGNLTELLRVTWDPIYLGGNHAFEPLPVIGGRAWVIFSGDQVAELWATDGTRGGTAKLMDLPDRRSGFPLFVANGLVFFATDEALWRTDGTEKGTFAVASNPEQIHAAGNSLFFTSRTTAHGRELWVTDGTLGGTHIVRDIHRGEQGAFPDAYWYDDFFGVMQAAGNVLFFTADDGVHGMEPWRSDGTEAGTFLLRDIAPGPASSMLPMFERTVTAFAGGSVFFGADDGVHGYELWRSDLQTAELVRDIARGQASSHPASLSAVGDMVYLAADDGRHGRELWWASSGGAGLVADVNPGSDSSHPREMTAFDGSIYFFATTEATGDELWRIAPPTVRRRAVR
jgi:ELWxxDGT repeat protein